MSQDKIGLSALIESAVNEIQDKEDNTTDAFNHQDTEASEITDGFDFNSYLIIPSESIINDDFYSLTRKERFKGSIETDKGTINFCFNGDKEDSLIIYLKDDYIAPLERFIRLKKVEMSEKIEEQELKSFVYVAQKTDNKGIIPSWVLQLEEITDSIYNMPNLAELTYRQSKVQPNNNHTQTLKE